MAFRRAAERNFVFDPNTLRPISEQRRRAPASMQPLAPVFERLELSHYTDIFVDNGFDTWEDVLDITENDLETLGVKIGHRRRLQREIASSRGLPIDQVIVPSGRASSLEATQTSEVGAGSGAGSGGHQRSESSHATATGTGTGKRRYRRHPKPDTNAPERPPSAYVLFSNKIREELKHENLSFTDMAKVVGEKWQQLDTDGREPFETEANELKDTYNTRMADYKKTDEWKEYQEYLANFKAAQQAAAPGQGHEGKRLKLERSGDGSYGSSRGSQGTPTTSAHGSPISTTTSLQNPILPDASPIHTAGSYPSAYQPPMPGRPGAVPTTRPPVIGQISLEQTGPFAPQNSLPPISTDVSQRPLPRRGQHPPAPFLSRGQDTSSSNNSQASGLYSPGTLDSGQRSASATSAETSTPYAQHHGMKNLNIAGLQERSIGRQSPAYSQASAPSPVYGPYPGPDPVSRTLPPLPHQQPPPAQQRLDGLAALALAGRLIDGERDAKDPRNNPG